ncbi:hypothetical protein JZU69_02410, partial [bacterium]|nr:hypothetical protein [bacterium]
MKIDAFTVKGGQLNLARREVVISDVLARGVRGLMRRAPDGRIEWIKPPALRVVEVSQKETSVPWKITVDR